MILRIHVSFRARHPFFINPMIYFPLLCLGVEKIFKKERPYLFIVITAVASMSNFYFLYMLTIFTVIYALIRFYQYYTKERLSILFCSETLQVIIYWVLPCRQ